MMNLHNFTRGAAVNDYLRGTLLRPLADDQLRRVCPSAFASTAHESRSDRYAYIPTSSIIEGMRKEGFVPVKAQQSASRVEGRGEFTKHMITFALAEAALGKVGDSKE